MTPRLARALEKARREEAERTREEKAAAAVLISTDEATEFALQVTRIWFDAYLCWVKFAMAWA